MIIQKISIRSFGGIKDMELGLTAGLNIIYGMNEAGKSTIAQFIKAILFGMDSVGRGQDIRNKDRLRYMPFDSDTMGGSMAVEHESRSYIISRTFGRTKSTDKMQVMDAVTGAILDMSPEELIGISEESFSKTLYIKQLSAKIDEDTNDEILIKLINLAQTGKEEASHKSAKELLTEALKELTSVRGRGIIPELHSSIASLQQERIASINAQTENEKRQQEIKRLQAEKQQLYKEISERSDEYVYRDMYAKWLNDINTNELKENFEREKRVRELETRLQSHMRIKRIYGVILALSSIISFLAVFYLPMLLLLPIAAVSLILFLRENKKLATPKEEDDRSIIKQSGYSEYENWFFQRLGTSDINKIPNCIDKYSMEFESEQNSKNNKAVEIAERIRDIEGLINSNISRPREAIDQEITMTTNQIKDYEHKADCITAAIESLDRAYTELKQNFTPKLNECTGSVIKKITGGKYTEVRADNVYSLTLTDEKGENIKADYLSSGCYDQIYFSLRMGIIKLLNLDAPIILDDAMSLYDDERLESAMEYLKELDNQVIIFTCQSREKGGNRIEI